MRRTDLKEEILKMRFIEVYDRHKDKGLSCEDASDILGVSVRTFLRYRRRFDEEGPELSFDRRLGKRSVKRIGDEEVEVLTKLYADRHRGFSVKHFYDYIKWQHPSLKVHSYNWCRLTLQKAGLIEKVGRGGLHRQRRERRSMTGMMLHQDASTHRWISALDYNVDLVITMDDADSKITSGLFVLQEGTQSSLQGIKETIETEGLFCTFYTDRGSHYAYTPQAGEKVDKSRLTQVGRALKQLGVKHIHAYSPQARGRSERMFATLQARLPKELDLAGVQTLEQANRYLKEVYLPRHNQLFSLKPKETKTAYTPWLHHQSLEEILCLQEERIVQKDNTVRYNTLILQIPPQETRHHYVKAPVEVREYGDGRLSVFYGHLCLGRYDQRGHLLAPQQQQVAA
jgi:transposase